MEKSFQELDLSNAFLFAAALEDPETCRLVLEIILGGKLPPVNVHAEHSILVSSDFRSVRLDIYANDKIEVNYNVEAQNKYSSVPLTPLERNFIGIPLKKDA